MADPESDSAGGVVVTASDEKTSERFAHNFMEYLQGEIWPGGGIKLPWVRGRNGNTVLTWSDKYASLQRMLTSRAQSASLNLKDQRIAARVDGSLQIKIPAESEVSTESENRMIFWSRHYYVVPFEVSPFQCYFVSNIPGKTLFRDEN